MSPQKKRIQHPSKPFKPSKTVACKTCGEAIQIPDHCQHGKKLANCHVTNCITSHITDHNDICINQVSPRRAETKPVNRPSPPKEHAVLTQLVKQELRNIEQIRGKEFQYLKGIPRAEALGRIDCMGLEDLRKLAEQLKSVGDGMTTAYEAMYDDEDSGDDDMTKCPTPPEEEEPAAP